MYIAEKKVPKSEPFYKQKSKTLDDGDTSKSEPVNWCHIMMIEVNNS